MTFSEAAVRSSETAPQSLYVGSLARRYIYLLHDEGEAPRTLLNDSVAIVRRWNEMSEFLAFASANDLSALRPPSIGDLIRAPLSSLWYLNFSDDWYLNISHEYLNFSNELRRYKLPQLSHATHAYRWTGQRQTKIPHADKIKAALSRYSKLKAKWAHEGSIKPSASSISAARQLYSLLKKQQLPADRSYVSEDGEVGLVWDNGRTYANVSFWPDHHVIFFVRDASGKKLRGDEVFGAKRLPPKLIKAIKKLS